MGKWQEEGGGVILRENNANPKGKLIRTGLGDEVRKGR